MLTISTTPRPHHELAWTNQGGGLWPELPSASVENSVVLLIPDADPPHSHARAAEQSSARARNWPPAPRSHRGWPARPRLILHAPASTEEDLSIRHGWRGLQNGEAVPSVWLPHCHIQCSPLFTTRRRRSGAPARDVAPRDCTVLVRPAASAKAPAQPSLPPQRESA